MTNAYQTTRRVEFRHTDAAGIAHFSVFFNYMEEVEHEFLRTVGLSVVLNTDDGRITWPRVAVRCDYQNPVRFEDVVDIELQVTRLGRKSVTYEFVFSHAGQPVAAGDMTAVCCRLQPGGKLESIAIPDWIGAKLNTATRN